MSRVSGRYGHLGMLARGLGIWLVVVLRVIVLCDLPGGSTGLGSPWLAGRLRDQCQMKDERNGRRRKLYCMILYCIGGCFRVRQW